MEDRNTFKRDITNSSSIFNNISNIRKPIIVKKYLNKMKKLMFKFFLNQFFIGKRSNTEV
jgi:hypothetical protein